MVFPVPTLLTSTKAPRQEEALKALRRPSASPASKVEDQDSAASELREELRGISRQLELLGSRQVGLVRTEAAALPAHRRGWEFPSRSEESCSVEVLGSTSLG